MERPSYHRQRHPVDATHRIALARPARKVRPLAETCFDRFNRWRRDGTWDRLLAHAQTKSDAVGDVEWEVSVDDTVIRAHQHAAGARSRPSVADEKRGS
jgi:transposase